jgi:hypothetical protein
MYQYLLVIVTIYCNGLFILNNEGADTSDILSFMQIENELC